MKFLDFFAGIGGFRRGMELAGHECVGFCEFDRFATASYISMHLITDEQRKYLATLDLKKRQKEILNEEYRNGEWYCNDIRSVDVRELPKADCWCFGFPCQDISIAGKQAGFKGNRSSLFFRVMGLLGQLKEEEKPEWLFIENVKNLLSVNGGWDFARVLTEVDEGGYDAEWEVLNSKDFGVPQNRERVFIVGHLRSRGQRNIFPLRPNDTETAELQRHEDRNRVITNTIDAKAERDTRGTFPIVNGGYSTQSERISQKVIYANYRKIAQQDVEVAKTLMARDYKGFNTGFDTMNAVVHEDNSNHRRKAEESGSDD